MQSLPLPRPGWGVVSLHPVLGRMGNSLQREPSLALVLKM